MINLFYLGLRHSFSQDYVTYLNSLETLLSNIHNGFKKSDLKYSQNNNRTTSPNLTGLRHLIQV